MAAQKTAMLDIIWEVETISIIWEVMINLHISDSSVTLLLC
jgi:hypothetical protein